MRLEQCGSGSETAVARYKGAASGGSRVRSSLARCVSKSSHADAVASGLRRCNGAWLPAAGAREASSSSGRRFVGETWKHLGPHSSSVREIYHSQDLALPIGPSSSTSTMAFGSIALPSTSPLQSLTATRLRLHRGLHAFTPCHNPDRAKGQAISRRRFELGALKGAAVRTSGRDSISASASLCCEVRLYWLAYTAKEDTSLMRGSSMSLSLGARRG